MATETYSRQELEHVAMTAAGAGAGQVMKLAPDVVMPSTEVVAAVQAVLRDFDERRGGSDG